MQIFGLAPYLNPQRPRDPARWWAAHGALEDATLRVDALAESASLPTVDGLQGPCGLAAPCSLPRVFLDHLGLEEAREVSSSASAAWLREQARVFAARAPRGQKHPRRDANESLSALDRRRLPLFHAALPLLRSGARVVEVDPPSLLRALALPADGLSGARPDAIGRRVRILEALREGALGFPVEVAPRDHAVAAKPALEAVLAAALAAWVHRHDPTPPADAEAWIPLP